MYVVKNTEKNVQIVEKIIDIRSDIELFHREMCDEEIDTKLHEIEMLEQKLQ